MAYATQQDIIDRYGEEQLTIAFEPAADLGRIEADPQRIEQVIANLLSNATKFAREGSTVRVTFSPTTAPIDPPMKWKSRTQRETGRALIVAVPAMETTPSLGVSMHPIMFNIVDFPEPEGPTMDTKSPSLI